MGRDREDADLARRLGAAVRGGRARRGWTQETLAERVGVSVDHVSLIERGGRLPSLGVLVRVVRALGLSLDEVVGSGAQLRRLEEAARLVEHLPADARAVVIAMLRAAADVEEVVGVEITVPLLGDEPVGVAGAARREGRRPGRS